MKKQLFLLILICFFQKKAAFTQNLDSRNLPQKTTSTKPIAEGREVWGVFDGRVPCQETANEYLIQVPANCEKLKWVFTFYINPKTGEPEKYSMGGSLYREKIREGKWAFIKGTKDNANATVIQLDPDKPKTSLFLLKGDENVLFILNKNKRLMIGDGYLSYTFNRVTN